MDDHKVVSRQTWLEARRQFLVREKEFTRQRDELARARRALPRVKIEENYVFEGPNGARLAGRPVRRSEPAHRLSLHVRPWLDHGLQELLVLGRQLRQDHRTPQPARREHGGHLLGAPYQARPVSGAHGLALQVAVVGGAMASTRTLA